jgi:lysophospholipase L1-like esterase
MIAATLAVLFIGDSITFGISSAPTGNGFADRLRGINIGCGGAPTAVWRPEAGEVACLGRFENEPIDYWQTLVVPNAPRAEVAVVMLGTNDALLGLPSQFYWYSIGRIVEGLQALGMAEVLLLPPPPAFGVSPEVQARLAGLAFLAGRLCEELEGVTCGPDVFNLLGPEDFAPGDVHPNRHGHRKIANALRSFLPRTRDGVP